MTKQLCELIDLRVLLNICCEKFRKSRAGEGDFLLVVTV